MQGDLDWNAGAQKSYSFSVARVVVETVFVFLGFQQPELLVDDGDILSADSQSERVVLFQERELERVYRFLWQVELHGVKVWSETGKRLRVRK